jgi:hypothetical protein
LFRRTLLVHDDPRAIGELQRQNAAGILEFDIRAAAFHRLLDAEQGIACVAIEFRVVHGGIRARLLSSRSFNVSEARTV